MNEQVQLLTNSQDIEAFCEYWGIEGEAAADITAYQADVSSGDYDLETLRITTDGRWYDVNAEWFTLEEYCWYYELNAVLERIDGRFLAQFERFEFLLKKGHAEDCYLSGRDAAHDVKAILELDYIQEQFRKIGPKLLADELYEYGAWEKKELYFGNKVDNQKRIIWLAASNIREEYGKDW